MVLNRNSVAMFHPPKVPQWQWNGNGTSLQQVPVANQLKSDVASAAKPFFQPLLAIVVTTTVFINLLNLRINLLNYNRLQ